MNQIYQQNMTQKRFLVRFLNKLYVVIITDKFSIPFPECIESCVGQGIRDVGVRRGGDCFCFTSRPTDEDRLLHVDEAQCRDPCKGDPSFFCGGTNALHIYATSENFGKTLSDFAS